MRCRQCWRGSYATTRVWVNWCDQRICIFTRQKSQNFFFWRVWHTDTDNRWIHSAHEIAQNFGKWQRVSSNKGQGEYQQITTEANWPEPQWPDATLEELLLVAFRGKIIDDIEHEVIKTLKGES